MKWQKKMPFFITILLSCKASPRCKSTSKRDELLLPPQHPGQWKQGRLVCRTKSGQRACLGEDAIGGLTKVQTYAKSVVLTLLALPSSPFPAATSKGESVPWIQVSEFRRSWCELRIGDPTLSRLFKRAVGDLYRIHGPIAPRKTCPTPPDSGGASSMLTRNQGR